MLLQIEKTNVLNYSENNINNWFEEAQLVCLFWKILSWEIVFFKHTHAHEHTYTQFDCRLQIFVKPKKRNTRTHTHAQTGIVTSTQFIHWQTQIINAKKRFFQKEQFWSQRMWTANQNKAPNQNNSAQFHLKTTYGSLRYIWIYVCISKYTCILVLVRKNEIEREKMRLKHSERIHKHAHVHAHTHSEHRNTFIKRQKYFGKMLKMDTNTRAPNCVCVRACVCVRVIFIVVGSRQAKASHYEPTKKSNKKKRNGKMNRMKLSKYV